MKVALVHDYLLKVGGAERVLKTLSEMYPDAPIYTLLYDEKRIGDYFDKKRIKVSSLQNLPKFLRNRHRYLLPFMPQAIEGFDLGEVDLILSSSGAFSHGVVSNVKAKHISYCHSPMRFAWDWTHEYMRELDAGILKKFMARRIIRNLRQWDFLASKRVDKYIANSDHVRKRINKYYRKGAEIVYPPVNISRFKVSNKCADYFLIVSRLSPYKRVDLAVELFNKVQRKLVVIGDGSHLAHLQRIAGPTVEMMGAQNDEVVTKYLENCRGVIFPGEDDFGIFPVEAMACGKPVIAFGKGGALETVIPGKTGEFFYDATVDSLEDALGRVMADYGRYKPEFCRKQAERFSEAKFKKNIKKVVKEIL